MDSRNSDDGAPALAEYDTSVKPMTRLHYQHRDCALKVVTCATFCAALAQVEPDLADSGWVIFIQNRKVPRRLIKRSHHQTQPAGWNPKRASSRHFGRAPMARQWLDFLMVFPRSFSWHKLLNLLVSNVQSIPYLGMFMENSYGYAKSLLEQRQQLLRLIELRHQQKLLPANDYISCRKSLSKAIDELENVLQSMEKTYLPKGREN